MKMFKFLFFLLGAAVGAILVVGWGCSVSGHRGPKKAHFDGRRFINKMPRTFSSRDLIRTMWMFRGKRWPEKDIEFNTDVPPQMVRKGIRATMVNHATVLIQFAGINILTDPVWSERVGPFEMLGPKRVHNPGIEFDMLPPIDVVLLSHNHYDHLDMATLRRLNTYFSPLVLTGLGNGSLLRHAGLINVREMDWWETFNVGNLRIHFVPAQHFSKRGLFDTDVTLWGGFVLESGDRKVYFAGDTGFSDHFEEIGRRFAPIDLSFLPIGSYEPQWFMKYAHLNPDEAVRIHKILQCRKSVGIHWGTFQLTVEQRLDPVRELIKARRKHEIRDEEFIAGQPGAVVYLEGKAAEQAPVVPLWRRAILPVAGRRQPQQG